MTPPTPLLDVLNLKLGPDSPYLRQSAADAARPVPPAVVQTPPPVQLPPGDAAFKPKAVTSPAARTGLATGGHRSPAAAAADPAAPAAAAVAPTGRARAAAFVVAPPASRLPAWFLDGKQRLDKIIKLGEQCSTLASLVTDKTRHDPALAAAWQADVKWLNGVMNTAPGLDIAAGAIQKEIDAKVAAAEATAQTGDHAAVAQAGAEAAVAQTRLDDVHRQYLEQDARRAALAVKARALYLPGLKQRLAQVLTKDPDSTTARALPAMGGDDAMLEMAQMGETYCRKAGIDPYQPVRGGPIEAPMEMVEVAALHGYSTQDYTRLNARLRAVAKGEASGPDPLDHYVGACSQALMKLPVYKGPATRCDHTLPQHVIDDLVKHGKRIEPALFSVGTKPGGVPGFGDIKSNITRIRTGREITMFSAHEGEGEILFPPGTVFKFESFTPEGGKTITKHKRLRDVLEADTKLKGTFNLAEA